MWTMRPMAGLRYGNDAGEPEALWAAAPHDPSSEEPRGERSILHLAHPLGKSDDRSRYIRYATAMAQLMDWRRNAILVPDDAPALYRVRIGDAEAWAGLAPLDQLEIPEVAPIDKTHPQRILEATMAYFEFPTAVAEFDPPVADPLAEGHWRRQSWQIARAESELAVRNVKILDGANIAAAALEVRNAKREATNWIPIWLLAEPAHRPMVPMGLLSWSQNEFR